MTHRQKTHLFHRGIAFSTRFRRADYRRASSSNGAARGYDNDE
jgi:hypothetical protein